MTHDVQGINNSGLKRIYHDRETVLYNEEFEKNLPALRVWLQDAGGKVIQCHNVMIRGWSEVRYALQEPDWDKAMVWVETHSFLTIIHEN
jgi:hypothetical protein